jgi:hypothetical protein
MHIRSIDCCIFHLATTNEIVNSVIPSLITRELAKNVLIIYGGHDPTYVMLIGGIRPTSVFYITVYIIPLILNCKP